MILIKFFTISRLELIKAQRRACMSNERFLNLATISINRELTPKVDVVIKKFWLSKDRKVNL